MEVFIVLGYKVVLIETKGRKSPAQLSDLGCSVLNALDEPKVLGHSPERGIWLGIVPFQKTMSIGKVFRDGLFAENVLSRLNSFLDYRRLVHDRKAYKDGRYVVSSEQMIERPSACRWVIEIDVNL